MAKQRTSELKPQTIKNLKSISRKIAVSKNKILSEQEKADNFLNEVEKALIDIQEGTKAIEIALEKLRNLL